MIISTKGRYGLHVMIDLAQQESDVYISLKSISERQNISVKYLEIIVSALNKGGLVKSHRGKDGGYMLTKPPVDYSIGEILQVSEGGLAPVSCPECEGSTCGKGPICLTLPVWRGLELAIDNYLDSITLADVLRQNVGNVNTL